MLIIHEKLSTNTVDILRRERMQVDKHEDFVDKWNSHIHIDY